MASDVILHIVRHGETTWNAERRLQGQLADVPLSERGWEQARELAEALAGTTASLIISSDLRRALDTAGVIAERTGLRVIPEPALRERHFGVAQGKLYSEVAPLVQEWWKRHDDRIEGGETNRELYERVGSFLARLREDPPARELILVSHGGVMNVALAWLAGHSLENMRWERVDNCEVRTVALGGELAAAAG